jgi:glycosyltransferase involved in cell wall biosynthesis
MRQARQASLVCSPDVREGRQTIYWFSISEQLGGAELFALNVAEAAAERARIIIVAAPGTPIVKRAHALGIETIEARLGPKLSRQNALTAPWRYLVQARRFRSLVQQLAAENARFVVHFQWETLLWLVTPRGVEVTMVEHGPIPEALMRMPLGRLLLRRAFARATSLFVVSDGAARSLARVTTRPFERLPAGVWPDRIDEARAASQAWRDRLVPSPGSRLVAYAGRVRRDKGVHDLVRLAAAREDVVVAIAGEGNARKQVEEHARRLGVDERVHLLGWLDDPLPLVAAADAVAFLSREKGEGRPLVCLEAAALNVPVIGDADSEALADLSAEFPGSCVLVDDHEPESLARALDTATRSASPREHKLVSWRETAALLAGAVAAPA